MTANNASYLPIQHPQHNMVQNVQVCTPYTTCDIPLLSHMSMQTLGSRDHELWSNEHLSGIDSASPYPAVNHADALPPARYTSTMGNEGPPHVTIASLHFIGLYVPFTDDGCAKGPRTTSRERKSTSF